MFGFHVGPILLFLLGVITLPIHWFVQLRERVHINKFAKIGIYFVVFMIGVLITPTQDGAKEADNGTTETVTEVVSTTNNTVVSGKDGANSADKKVAEQDTAVKDPTEEQTTEQFASEQKSENQDVTEQITSEVTEVQTTEVQTTEAQTTEMQATEAQVTKEQTKESVLILAKEGIQFLKRNPMIMTLLLFMAGINLVSSAFDAILPGYVLPNPIGGQAVLGIVTSCSGVAMIIGSLIASVLPKPTSPQSNLSIGLVFDKSFKISFIDFV